MSTSRDRILTRLRKTVAQADALPAIADHQVFRYSLRDRSQAVASFASKLDSLKGEFHHVASPAPAAAKLKELLQSTTDGEQARTPRFIRQSSELIDTVINEDVWLTEHVIRLEGEYSNQEFAQFEVGITSVDFLIARTGSILLSSASAGGRRLSVLPAFHIAIATSEQVVSSLDEALRRFEDSGRDHLTSYATLITGPSRTADIEKILVLGAHGPKRLAVILIDTA